MLAKPLPSASAKSSTAASTKSPKPSSSKFSKPVSTKSSTSDTTKSDSTKTSNVVSVKPLKKKCTDLNDTQEFLELENFLERKYENDNRNDIISLTKELEQINIQKEKALEKYLDEINALNDKYNSVFNLMLGKLNEDHTEKENVAPKVLAR